MDFLVSLGILLLFFPPFLTAMAQNLLKKYPILIDFVYNMVVGSILTGLLIALVPQAAGVFIFYFVLFFVSRLVIRSGSIMRINQLDAFTLSVYICFITAVLWEIPIQLTIYQNIDAVILSGFKALAIPLFIHKIYSLGWRLHENDVARVFGLIMIGYFIGIGIFTYGIETMFWITHLFRIPILIMLYKFIPFNITHINTTKEYYNAF